MVILRAAKRASFCRNRPKELPFINIKETNMDQPKSSTTRFFAAFVLGGLLCVAVAVLATWADLESAYYGFDRRGSTPIRNLHCPILLNRRETGVVSVKLSNT